MLLIPAPYCPHAASFVPLLAHPLDPSRAQHPFPHGHAARPQALLQQQQQEEHGALQQEPGGLQREPGGLQEQHGGLQQRVSSLQHALARAQRERREAERVALRLEKDKGALKKTLDKVEREKLQAQEASLRLSAEQGRLHRSLRAAQQELAEAQQRVRMLQALALEHPSPPSSRPSAELQRELEARERIHHHRIRGLEEQITLLKGQELHRHPTSI